MEIMFLQRNISRHQVDNQSRGICMLISDKLSNKYKKQLILKKVLSDWDY